MEIAEQNRNETEYLYDEIYRKKNYVKHGMRVREGGCVFDVGANIGLFSLFMKQNRRGVRVYAFEPIKPIYELKAAIPTIGAARASDPRLPRNAVLEKLKTPPSEA